MEMNFTYEQRQDENEETFVNHTRVVKWKRTRLICRMKVDCWGGELYKDKVSLSLSTMMSLLERL